MCRSIPPRHSYLWFYMTYHTRASTRTVTRGCGQRFIGRTYCNIIRTGREQHNYWLSLQTPLILQVARLSSLRAVSNHLSRTLSQSVNWQVHYFLRVRGLWLIAESTASQKTPVSCRWNSSWKDPANTPSHDNYNCIYDTSPLFSKKFCCYKFFFFFKTKQSNVTNICDNQV
jgi:hypothetical protein